MKLVDESRCARRLDLLEGICRDAVDDDEAQSSTTNVAFMFMFTPLRERHWF